jgi:NAD(P)-dependent dehydrogenase (short-subunit alcohol dehydrogenase family)
MAADINEQGLVRLAEARKGSGKALATMTLDISDAKACAAAVRHTESALGSLDILINNGALGMGVVRDDHFTNLVGIDEIEPEMWDRFMRVNVNGAWYLTRAAVPGMKARKFGRIVNVTTSMFTMLRGKFHPYGPSKAALEAMSAGHAQEFDGTGITVNVVVPGGPADTPMVPASSGLQRGDLIPPAVMLGPILWLCSPAGDGVTGRRYVAAEWKAGRSVEANRAAAEAAAGWPSLAQTPVWPGGKPQE